MAIKSNRAWRRLPSPISFRTLSASLALAVASLAPAPAAAEWREASSDHFLIYANAEERWLTGFAGRLERLDSAMRLVRDIPAKPGARSNRLTIYVVPNMDAVQRLCGKCGNVGGFYVPRAGGSIAYTPRRTDGGGNDPFSADLVLFHEYAHHLMLENFAAAYPRWFVEGFAEFNATAEITSITVRPGRSRSLPSTKATSASARGWIRVLVSIGSASA